MIRFIIMLLAVLIFSAPLPVAAKTAATENLSLWRRFTQRVNQTWNSPTWDLYVPVYTWHNRLLYDSDKTAGYNETPWGVGIGKSFTDEDGDWHALYYIGFQDSNDMYQPMAGYAFQKNWGLDDAENWRAGVGFTLGITARQEYDYIPLPLPLPIAGVQYKKLALQAAYVPGGYNDGNVLFCWLRWQLN